MQRFLRKMIILLTVSALVLLSGCGLTPEAVLDVIAPSESPVPGADLTFEGVQDDTVEPLKIAYSDMTGDFCPFWATRDGDCTVAAMTQIPLQSSGDKPSSADITRTENEDGSTTVTIRLQSGLRCPDGYELTADDVLFSYYVVLDESYNGPYQVKVLPIRGLSSYWNGIDSDMYTKYVVLFDETYRNGKYNSDLESRLEDAKAELARNGVPRERWMSNTEYREVYNALKNYDEDRAEIIRAAVEAAWRQDAANLVEYIMQNYSATITIGMNYTIEQIRENDGLQVMAAMRERLFGQLNEDGSFTSTGGRTWNLIDEFPTVEDFFNETYEAYKGDVEQYWLIEGVGRASMIAAVENALVLQWASEDRDWRGPVISVEGIEKIDDYTVSITLDYCDDSVFSTLVGIYVVPMHVYGNEALFDPENGTFGFSRGDLRSVEANAKLAIGAGEFVYSSTDIRTVYLVPNENYWQGMSEIPQVILSKDFG